MPDPIDADPKGGGGSKSTAASGENPAPGASGGHRQDEGRGEGGGSSYSGGRGEGGDATKTASKGINPVQHSE